MPVRKRPDKRRPEAGLDIWYDFFESELSEPGAFEDACIDLAADGQPANHEVQKAWRLLAAEFADEFAARHPRGAHFTPWAFEHFGTPRDNRHASTT
jgi:hypothetical protein